VRGAVARRKSDGAAALGCCARSQPAHAFAPCAEARARTAPAGPLFISFVCFSRLLFVLYSSSFFSLSSHTVPQLSELVWHVGAEVPLVLCVELICGSRSVGWTRVPLPRRGVALQGKCTLKLSADDHTRKHATALTLRLYVGSGVVPVTAESALAESGDAREFSELLQAMRETRAAGGHGSSDAGSAVATNGTPMNENGGSVGRQRCPELFTRLFEEADVWRRERAAERDAIHR